MPYPDDEIRGLQNEIVHIKNAIRFLAEKVRDLSETYYCLDCGVDVPYGRGLGFSVPEEEWTDRSKSRPINITHLCHPCIAKRLAKDK